MMLHTLKGPSQETNLGSKRALGRQIKEGRGRMIKHGRGSDVQSWCSDNDPFVRVVCGSLVVRNVSNGMRVNNG